MATINQQKPVVVRGGRLEYFPCTAAQTWYRGQCVYLTSYGRLTVCSSDATVAIGMAASDNAASAVDTSYPVYVFDEDTMIELNVYHSTPASATVVKSLVGNSYNYRSATYWSYCDRSAQTVPFWHVEAVSPKDANNDLFGRVWCSVVPEVRQVAGRVA